MRYLAILLVIGVSTGFTPGEPPSEPEAVEKGTETGNPGSAVLTSRDLRPTDGETAASPFSLYLADAEIRDVLHMLGRHFNLNIITTPDVQGKISVYFTGVDPDQALGAIVNSNGFSFRREGSIIEVFRPSAEEAPAPTSTTAPSTTLTLVELIHAEAAEIATTMSGLMSEGSATTFTVEARRNALVIKGPTDEVESVVGLVRELDHPVPQIRIEVQILETVISDSERYGIDWFARVLASGSRRPHTFPFDNTVTGGNYWPKSQTQGDDLTFSSATGTTQSSSLPLFPDGSAFPFASVEDFIFGYLDASQFTAVMELIQAETNTRLISRPEITTQNNREAIITIGNEVPIPTYTRNDDTSVVNISGYEDKYIGTTLSVLPRVTEADHVSMRIRPEISDILEFRGEGLFQLPVTATRSAETTVTLEDGKTLVIGGLVREREVKKESKLPFLGDIPGLKYLFSYSGTDIEKSDLLIFITPHILGKDRMENTGKVEFEGEWLTEPQLADVSGVRARLGSGDVEDRLAGIAALDRVRDETILRVIDPNSVLRRMMERDPSTDVRLSAALELCERDPAELLAAMRTVAGSKDPRATRVLVRVALAVPAIHLRVAAAEAAATLDRFTTIELLNRAAATGTDEIAERAAIGLWMLGDGSAAPIVLFGATENTDAYLEGAVVRCLSTQGGANAAQSRAVLTAAGTYPGQLLSWVQSRDDLLESKRVPIGPLLERFEQEGAEIAIIGSPYERKKLEEAIGLLDQRAASFGHLVRSFLSRVEVVDGPTEVGADTDASVLRLSRRDLEAWPAFSLGHQLVRYAAGALMSALGCELCDVDATVLEYRTQYWAVHTLLGIDGEQRADYRGFLDSVLARHARESRP